MRIKFDHFTFTTLMAASKQFSVDPASTFLESRKIVSEVAKEFEKKHLAKALQLQYFGDFTHQKQFAVKLTNYQLIAFDIILRFWAANDAVEPEFKLSQLQIEINRACLSI